SAGIGPRNRLQTAIPTLAQRLPPLPAEQGIAMPRRTRRSHPRRKREGGKTTDGKEREKQRSDGTQATCMPGAAKRRHRAGTRRKGYTRNYDHRP
ncbi:MAG: hypothetical protein K2O55_00945, partial [Alistipes sp.]|nr:hypothetical protein [Alistipes sp.]